ncbi:MAG: cytidylate kinase-like family protein, partial [Dehalococcoidia bacterium]
MVGPTCAIISPALWCGRGQKMQAISISRQMGSGGDELAERVAAQLKWGRVSYEVINRAGLAAGAPQVALAEIDELGLLNLRPTAAERRAYQRQVERIIRELAEAGLVVIVGRGSQVILQGQPGVLHVRVIAPFEARIVWLQQEKQLSAEAASA